MLLDFQVENFRSYHNPQRFSLVASRQEDLPANVMDAEAFGLRVLRSAAIYGANASGKSNLFHALWALGDILRLGPDASRREEGDWPPPFALSEAARRQPTRFEINFLAQDEDVGGSARYEYHIGLLAGRVVEEWLNVYPAGGKRQRWFEREPADSVPANVKFSRSVKGAREKLRDVTPPGMAFLFAAERFGNRQLSIPARWIQRNCYNRFEYAGGMTAEHCHTNSSFSNWVSDFMRHADLGIVGLHIEQEDVSPDNLGSSLPPPLAASLRRMMQYEFFFLHRSESGAPVRLDPRFESTGTHRLFTILGPIGIALQEGFLVLVDEMSASMHPMLTHRLIEAFHDPKVNAKGAQLVLTTHDVSLLRDDLFRRDQVWFAEKSSAGETNLYSLHKFQPRNDVSLEKNYLAGRYGGIPFLGALNFGRFDGSTEEGEQEGKKPRRRAQPRKVDEGTPTTGT